MRNTTYEPTLKEVLEFLRCLKGNHTIDFNTIPAMCDKLFDCVEGWSTEFGDSQDEELIDEFKKYFPEPDIK